MAGNHDSLSLMTAAMVAGKAKNLYLKFHTRNRVNLETSKPVPCPCHNILLLVRPHCLSFPK